MISGDGYYGKCTRNFRSIEVLTYAQLEDSDVVTQCGGRARLSSDRPHWWVEKSTPEEKEMTEWWRASGPLRAHLESILEMTMIKHSDHGHLC